MDIKMMIFFQFPPADLKYSDLQNYKSTDHELQQTRCAENNKMGIRESQLHLTKSPGMWHCVTGQVVSHF